MRTWHTISSFCVSQGAGASRQESLWNSAVHGQNGSPHINESGLETPSQTGPEVCHLGDSRCCQTDEQY